MMKPGGKLLLVASDLLFLGLDRAVRGMMGQVEKEGLVTA